MDNRRDVHTAQTEDDVTQVDVADGQFKEFSIGECCANVSACKNDESVWFTEISINGVIVSCKVDTGAQINILAKSDFDKLNSKNIMLDQTQTKLTGYTGHQIPVLGVVNLSFGFRGQSFRSEFYVTTAKNHSLIGLPTLKLVGLLSVAQVEKFTPGTDIGDEFADVFKGLGKLDFEHSIMIRQDVKPVVCSVRPVPINIQPKLRDELVRLQALDIIQKNDEPSEWVSPIVVIPKPDNRIRLCLDPRHLNRAIQREHYKIPTCQEIFS